MFTLSDYEREIREGATKAKIPNEEALKRFIYNLTVIKPHFDDFPDTVNFRTLGQQWNSLSSDIRNEQRSVMINTLSRAARTRAVSKEV